MRDEKAKPALIVIVLFLVLLAVGVFIYNNVSTKEKNNKSNSNKESNIIQDQSNNNSNVNIISNSNIVSNDYSNVVSNNNSNIFSNNNSNIISNSNSGISIKSTSNINRVTKTYTATFVGNGATINKTKISCSTNSDSCKVYVPPAIKKGFTILGYSTNKNDTKAQIKEGSYVLINKNITYYAISVKEVTATFIKSKADDPKTVVKKCYIYNQGTTCNITVPRYYKTGSYDNTWALTPNENSPYVTSDTVLKLNNNVTYYAQYHNGWYRPPQANWREDRNISIGRVFTIGDYRVEYEKGIPDNVINKHITFIKKVHKLYPWYFLKGKVFVLTKDTYKKVSTAFGIMTYSYDWFSLDLQYVGNNEEISENATLHEMAHAFDRHYAYAEGKGLEYKYILRCKSDISSFYDIVHNSKKETLTSGEWMAAIITDWFWHYKHLDDSKPYYSGYLNYSNTEKTNIMKMINYYMVRAAKGYK